MKSLIQYIQESLEKGLEGKTDSANESKGHPEEE